MTAIDPKLRDRLALAFDVDDLVEATRMAKQLVPWFAVAKVGLELFSATGPDAVAALADCGYRVFLDIKLHDIPNTVEKAARVAGSLGARKCNRDGSLRGLRDGVVALDKPNCSRGTATIDGHNKTAASCQ